MEAVVKKEREYDEKNLWNVKVLSQEWKSCEWWDLEWWINRRKCGRHIHCYDSDGCM